MSNAQSSSYVDHKNKGDNLRGWGNRTTGPSKYEAEGTLIMYIGYCGFML